MDLRRIDILSEIPLLAKLDTGPFSKELSK